MKPLSGFALALGIGVSVISCDAQPTDPMTPASARVPRIDAAEAADSIAHMRCDREQRCDRIGPLESVGTFTQCIEKMHLEVAEGMNKNCIEGVTRGNLRYCMGEIAASDCALVDESSYPACRAARLCR